MLCGLKGKTYFCRDFMNLTHRSVLICSVLHLLVDGTCACALYLLALNCGANILSVFIIYNVLAFLTQPLTGFMADMIKRQKTVLLSSAILLSTAVVGTAIIAKTGVCSPTLWTLASVATLLGIGNSLFHVWGGRLVAIQTKNDIRALGIFVSTGAMGLAIGFVACSWGLLSAMIVAIWVAYTTISPISPIKPINPINPIKPINPINPITPITLFFLLLIIAFVMFRSYIGDVFTAGIERSNTIVLTIATITMLGKIAGGFISRWIGWVPAAIMLVLAVIICSILKTEGALNAAAIIGIFAINCTMPITLYLANRRLPGREGLAFGLLAAALIPPYLLALL